MANHYVQVGSITNAMRGKRLLEQQGIRAFLQRASGSEKEGCGYSLLLKGDVADALKILQRGGVRAIRVTDTL